jgi:hypothetical protein
MLPRDFLYLRANQDYYTIRLIFKGVGLKIKKVLPAGTTIPVRLILRINLTGYYLSGIPAAKRYPFSRKTCRSITRPSIIIQL